MRSFSRLDEPAAQVLDVGDAPDGQGLALDSSAGDIETSAAFAPRAHPEAASEWSE